MNINLPNDFTGLMYYPNAENGVYLMMGLLWQYLPHQFAFTTFELDPHKEGLSHTKYLDAKAFVRVDRRGEWKEVRIEFKLNSSGLRSDLKKHPGLRADYLICWVHDDLEMEKHVGSVLALEPIYRGLPPEVRNGMILYEATPQKAGREKGSLAGLLQRFSAENRGKVEYILEKWPERRIGGAEIHFLTGDVTVFRACGYSSQHLIIAVNLSSTFKRTSSRGIPPRNCRQQYGFH